VKIPDSERSPIHRITDAQWEELRLKLQIYAWRKCRWLRDLTGIDLDDLVQQAIVDTYTGKRRWPPIDPTTGEERTDVSLFAFLCQTVRSLASHDLRRPRKVDIGGTSASNEDSPTEPAYVGAGNPFFLKSSDIERAAEFTNLTDKMLQLVSTDEELSRIVRLWRACPDLRPREMVDALQMTMPQMRAAQKRLRRILTKGLRRSGDE